MTFFKIHIFSRLEKSWEDKIALRQTTNKQTTTTNTIDDHNSPSGFFQNPWANDLNDHGAKERLVSLQILTMNYPLIQCSNQYFHFK